MGDRVFEPKVHIERFINTVPEQVRLGVYTVHNEGIAGLLDKVKEHGERSKAATLEMKDKKDKKDEGKDREQARQEAIVEYERRKSAMSREFGDPYSTVFVAHIPVGVDEAEIERVVRGKTPGLSRCEVRLVRRRGRRGRRARRPRYAFVTVGSRQEARRCVSCCRRAELGGRSVAVEIERGRIVKNWLPRRLRGRR